MTFEPMNSEDLLDSCFDQPPRMKRDQEMEGLEHFESECCDGMMMTLVVVVVVLDSTLKLQLEPIHPIQEHWLLCSPGLSDWRFAIDSMNEWVVRELMKDQERVIFEEQGRCVSHHHQQFSKKSDEDS